MLLPKFSIRLLLLIMVGVAMYATAVTYAIQGNPWLMGVATGLGSLAVVALVYGVSFLLFGLWASVLPKRGATKQTELPESQPPAPRPPVAESPH